MEEFARDQHSVRLQGQVVSGTGDEPNPWGDGDDDFVKSKYKNVR